MDGGAKNVEDAVAGPSDAEEFVMLPARCSQDPGAQDATVGLSCAAVEVMPRARWSRALRPLYLTLEQHATLVEDAGDILRSLITEKNYDSVSNLVDFYDTYTKANMCLRHLFAKNFPLNTHNNTCVGLAVELMKRWQKLDKKFACFALATSFVSCDEDNPDMRRYILANYGPSRVKNADKNHVLVCVRVIVDGRAGVLLVDLGYHISRVVTVMCDRRPPHTGVFRQSETPLGYKEFLFQFNFPNQNYVEFYKRTKRGNTIKVHESLIYVAQPFLGFMTITEKRNLVVDFRAMIARTAEGHLSAGLYFSLPGSYEAEKRNEHPGGQFTIFSDTAGEKRKSTYRFDMFNNPAMVPPSVREEIDACGLLLHLKKNELFELILRLTDILSNQPFMIQLLDLNGEVSRAIGICRKRGVARSNRHNVNE